MQSGLVFNIQRYSIQDGPGIRTTVFLKGCPLRCWWCHNPESQAPEPEITVIENRCIQCGVCLAVCPQAGRTDFQSVGVRRTDSQSVQAEGIDLPSAERAGTDSGSALPQDDLKRRPTTPGRTDCQSVLRYEGGLKIRPTLVRCTRCGACVEACPTEARQLVGRRMTVDEVLADVLKDRLFYDDSGGGVTFSGGEPLVQPEFLMGLLTACRARAIHTAVDTSGYAPKEQLLATAALTDLFLYDLKTMDDARHLECTGVSNAVILENLLALGQAHQNLWIRIPIVPGFNDDAEQLEAAARFVASIPAVRQVSLLPYHPTGTGKSRWLGRHVARPPAEDSMLLGHASLSPSHPEPPPSEYMEEAADRFRAFGLNTQTGG